RHGRTYRKTEGQKKTGGQERAQHVEHRPLVPWPTIEPQVAHRAKFSPEAISESVWVASLVLRVVGPVPFRWNSAACDRLERRPQRNASAGDPTQATRRMVDEQ